MTPTPVPPPDGIRSGEQSDPPGASGFARTTGLAVAVCAAVLGVLSGAPDTATAAAIALAVALFAFAERVERGTGGVAAIPPATPIAWPLGVRLAIAAAVALCLAAAAAVFNGASLRAQHVPWAGALALLAGAAAMMRPAAPLTRFERRDWAAVAILLLACLPLFFWNLTSIPAEVHGDEAETALDALRLLEESDRGLFSTSWFGLPILHAAPTALGFLTFGPDLTGLRLTSAALASLSVVLLFAIARRWVAMPLAFTAALLLASQRYFIHLGRAGYHYIDTPFLSLLALWLMIRLWQDRRGSAAIWCGIALGIGIQTYYASRLVPLLIAATALAFATQAPRGARRRYVTELLLVAVIATAVAAPMLTHSAQHWDEFWGRTQETSLFNAESRHHLAYAYGTDSLAELLPIQLQKALGVFHFTGDSSVQYGYRAPMLDLLGGILFLAGLGSLAARPRSALTIICILWIALPLLIGGALTIDAPFYPRISGIVPFVAIAIALGAQRAARGVAETFAAPARRRRVAAVLMAAAVTTVIGSNTGSYFGNYARNYRHSPMREIAEWMSAQGRGAKTYFFDELRHASVFHGTITFLAGSFARADVPDVDAFLADRSIDPRRSRFVVMQGSEAVLPRLEETFGPLEITPVTIGPGDHVRFYAARPAGQDDYGLDARPPVVNAERALPWLALLAALAALAALGAVLDRLRAARAPAPTQTAPLAVDEPAQAIATVAPRTPSRGTVLACLAVIVAIGAALRFTQLEELPAGFYCDEAGNIYNAASILRTGRDETGERLPLYVWSFGTSYKNPVFIYASMLPAAIFGPGPLAARFTAAAFGLLGVVAIFFLGRAIAGPVVGLFAALFLAVVPWHVHFSRIAFELISFPALFTIGAVGLIAFLDGRRSLAWAAAVLGLSLYTYVPAKLFVPLFVASFALIFRHELWRRRSEAAIALAVLAMVAAPVVIFDLVNQEQASSYLRGTTFVTPDMSVADIAAQLANNYSHFFSPIFLFHSGDAVLRHAVRGHGELYPVLAPLLLLGLAGVVQSRSKGAALVLVWLALYPLAAIFIRREIPSASRSIIGVPAFCLLAAIGADWVWNRLGALRTPSVRAGVWRAVAVAGLLIVLGAQTVRYWRLYSESYPLYSAETYLGFQYGHEQVVDYFLRHYDEYDRLILTTSLSNQPEVFLRLFAGMKQPPSPEAPPFEMPPKLNRGAPTDMSLYRDDRLLFAAVPRDLLYFADYDIVDKVTAPDGTAAFLLVDLRQAKDFAYVWMVAGPYPATDTPAVPDYDPASPPAAAPGGTAWQRYQQRAAAVTLDVLYGEDLDASCAWAINFVHSPIDQRVQVLAGFDDTGEIWVNDQQIELRDDDNAFATWVDTSIGAADLRAGRNKIAVKTCDEDGGWRFYFRLAGDDGRRVEGIDWEYVFEEGL